MKKATQPSSDPFAQYFKAYQELTQSLEQSKTLEDITQLTNKINSILQLHYKAIMSHYDKQYRQILEHLEENSKRFENLAQKTSARTHEFLDQSVKQSQQMMQQNMTHFKELFKAAPTELLEKMIAQVNTNFSTQTERWNELYAKQQEDMQKDLQVIQAQAKQLLENSEQLRVEALEKYKELEKSMQDFLTKKHKEVKDKEKGTEGH
ncbi:MAG: hypothetical protein JSR17_09190 [Proteobacteria bacterium]|nr:hypothetical protein [Pseudomonadota bacterium]